MRIRTKRFLKEKFREYYQSSSMYIPHRLKNREWGFIMIDDNYPDKTVMKRHKSFSSEKQLRSYVESMTPAHAYFSSAYYTNPGIPKMDGKEWLGADVVFDLDADHLSNSEDLRYEEQLNEVKKETIRLIDDFLLDDLGFDLEDLIIVFSGGRGYHVHICSEDVRNFGSPERKEIVDYVYGTGLENIIEESNERSESMDRAVNILKLNKDFSTWAERIHKWIVEVYLKEISKLDKSDAIEKLSMRKGVGETIAERIYEAIKVERKLNRIKETGNLDIAKGVPKIFWMDLVSKAKKELRVEPDEPVTSDIKRLIRLPSSLHGGTGLIVRPMSFDELDNFNPLNDAVAFDNKDVDIKGNDDFSINLKGNEISIEEGKIKSVPEFAAVFLSCSGFVEVEGW